MAFPRRGDVHSQSAMKEQIITEFFAKVLHIILESRAPYVSSRNYSGEQAVSSPCSSSSSTSSHKPRDKWFNLALGECPAALENIDFWRQSNLDPMIVDVVLIQRALDPESLFKGEARNHDFDYLNLRNEDFRSGRIERVIERWIVQYEIRKGGERKTSGKTSGGNLHTLYKKAILLLRSLCSTLRFLPAYKLFRQLISCGNIRTYTLRHRVHSFVEPFSCEEEADMNKFSFCPVDTSCGRLCISVLYLTKFKDLNAEPSMPMSPQFIPDYVDSPLADKLKRLPSLNVSQSLPSYSSFSRQHGWGGCHAQFAPPESDSRGSISKTRSLVPPMSLPHHLQEKFSYKVEVQKVGILEGLSSSSLESGVLSATTSLSLGTGHSLRGDESGRFSEPRISSSSPPRFSISRTSSRLSIQDDYDDSEFTCHFVLDNDDMADEDSRPSESSPMRKSQDAAVGALVLMLRKAPSLHRDPTNSTSAASPAKPVNTKEASTLHPNAALSKTATDALTELRSYKDLKEQFLRQGGGGLSQLLNKDL